MNILFIHLGNQCECLCSSNIIKLLSNKYKNTNITVIVKSKEAEHIYKYNNNVNKIFVINKVPSEIIKKEYDLLVNLHPDFSFDDYFIVNAKEKLGFHFSEYTKKYEEILYKNKKTNKNIFQIYFSLCNLVWKGEGYDFRYYPKTKNRHGVTGLLIANSNLKIYIIDKLNLNLSKIYNIPIRKNIFKKMDEINKCPNIITDDFFSLNCAMNLRKSVFFLETIPFNFSIELFGKGKVFKVPREIVR